MKSLEKMAELANRFDHKLNKYGQEVNSPQPKTLDADKKDNEGSKNAGGLTP